jgi:hypothetical protein
MTPTMNHAFLRVTMSRKLLSGLAASLAVLAFSVMTVGSASGATLKVKGALTAEAFLAIYGFPNHVNGAERPVGGSLGRNFGFGQNLLFRAGNGVGTAPLSITLNGEVVHLGRDTFIGVQLESNHTGAGAPVASAIDFVDMQDAFIGAAKGAWYADTSDQPWIMKICSPAAAVGACKTDPAAGAGAGEGADPGEVKIEDVSLDLGPGIVLQGTVWGKWSDGKPKVPPCITLHLPGAVLAGIRSQTLYVTQGPMVGVAIAAISGKVCLYSANNKWSKAPAEGAEGAEEEEPEIVLTNE